MEHGAYPEEDAWEFAACAGSQAAFFQILMLNPDMVPAISIYRHR